MALKSTQYRNKARFFDLLSQIYRNINSISQSKASIDGTFLHEILDEDGFDEIGLRQRVNTVNADSECCQNLLNKYQITFGNQNQKDGIRQLCVSFYQHYQRFIVLAKDICNRCEILLNKRFLDQVWLERNLGELDLDSLMSQLSTIQNFVDA